MVPKKIMDVIQLDATVSELLRNPNVEFVQVYTCADYRVLDDDSPEGEFRGWYDYLHLKRKGTPSPEYRGSVFDFITESDRYEITDPYLLSLEYRLRSEKKLRTIEIDQNLEDRLRLAHYQS